MTVRGRSYSDPSYGSEKTLYSQLWSAGTRATALVENVAKPMSPIEITDFNVLNTVLGTGGTSQWVLAATSSIGTTVIGTISLAGTHAANAYLDGTVTTPVKVASDGALHLYSVLSTASPAPIVRFNIQYQEYYDTADN